MGSVLGQLAQNDVTGLDIKSDLQFLSQSGSRDN